MMKKDSGLPVAPSPTNSLSLRFLLLTVCLLLFVFQPLVNAQDNTSAKDLTLYSQIKSFSLTGGAVDVKGLVVKKDRAQITLDGTLYLAAPANGQITGAVFIGEGTFALETPPTDFEQANIRRLTGMDAIQTDLKTAVFRFTDDTAQQLRARSAPPSASTEVGSGCRVRSCLRNSV